MKISSRRLVLPPQILFCLVTVTFFLTANFQAGNSLELSMQDHEIDDDNVEDLGKSWIEKRRDQEREYDEPSNGHETERDPIDDEDEELADSNNDNLCLTDECVMAAGKILNRMNKSVDPCNDFYDHVCGKFEQNHEPFRDMSRTMSFESLRRRNRYNLHFILKKMPVKSGLKAIDNVKAIYDSCMTSDAHGAAAVERIKAILGRYGPWPLESTSWNPDNWNFKKSLNNINLILSARVLFDFGVQLHPKNPNSYALSVGQAGLGLPRKYYNSKDSHKLKVVEAYFTRMVKIMQLFGYQNKNLVAKMKDVLEFEKKLAKIFITNEILRKPDIVLKEMKPETFFKILPEIFFEDYLKRSLHLVGFKISDVKTLIVHGMQYFKDLRNLIKNTKRETLANYMFWKVIFNYESFGGKPLHVERMKFMKIYAGVTLTSPNWDLCAITASSWMPFAYGRIYVNHKFKSKHAKEETNRLVSEIKHSFVDNLKHVTWMSKETKKKAGEKAMSIVQLVGYPEYILDDKKLEKKYHGLQLNNDDFFGNALKMTMFNAKESFRQLKKIRDRKEWSTGPSVVNAFYSQTMNRIVFPAGVLQPLFYHHDYPSPMKYGGIGSIIGHELSHAFDDVGRKYDKEGKLVQWWNSGDITNFEKKADCIRKQYSSYSIYGKYMNGQLSAGENIADIGGVKIAYKAFQKHLKTHPKPQSLPGLQNLTPNQLFFLSFAKTWCLIEPKSATLNNIVSDHHSYPKFRVKGALSNSKDFAKAFNCKRGSVMNPIKKCDIW